MEIDGQALFLSLKWTMVKIALCNRLAKSYSNGRESTLHVHACSITYLSYIYVVIHSIWQEDKAISIGL